MVEDTNRQFRKVSKVSKLNLEKYLNLTRNLKKKTTYNELMKHYPPLTNIFLNNKAMIQ